MTRVQSSDRSAAASGTNQLSSHRCIQGATCCSRRHGEYVGAGGSGVVVVLIKIEVLLRVVVVGLQALNRRGSRAAAACGEEGHAGEGERKKKVLKKAQAKESLPS